MQVLIDNKGGAGGNVGATIAAKAAPDGYTWFMGAVHHAIAPAMYPKLDYKLQEDFVPVALLASVPQVIVVNPQRVAAKTLPELLTELGMYEQMTLIESGRSGRFVGNGSFGSRSGRTVTGAASSTIRISHSCVVRPMCSGRAVPCTQPLRTPRTSRRPKSGHRPSSPGAK